MGSRVESIPPSTWTESGGRRSYRNRLVAASGAGVSTWHTVPDPAEPEAWKREPAIRPALSLTADLSVPGPRVGPQQRIEQHVLVAAVVEERAPDGSFEQESALFRNAS